MLCLIKKWAAKRNEPTVYPQLAYIYSTPFTSTNKRSLGEVTRDGGEQPEDTVRAGRARGGGPEMYYDNLPHLEVDLGDRTPFLGPSGTTTAAASSTAMSGALRDPSQVAASRTRFEEHEDMEMEMRQPMLPMASHYREPSPPKEF